MEQTRLFAINFGRMWTGEFSGKSIYRWVSIEDSTGKGKESDPYNASVNASEEKCLLRSTLHGSKHPRTFRYSSSLVLSLVYLSQVPRSPKCDTHGHFCLIFGNIAIITKSSTLISKINVAKLNSCVKMMF